MLMAATGSHVLLLSFLRCVMKLTQPDRRGSCCLVAMTDGNMRILQGRIAGCTVSSRSHRLNGASWPAIGPGADGRR